MEEDIKIVEDLKNKWELNAFGDMSNVLSLNEIKAIENLIKGFRELEDKSEEQAKFIENIQDNMGHKGMTKTELAFVCASLEYDNKELEKDLKNSIPKSKLQEKKEELEEKKKRYGFASIESNILLNEIQLLKELMEDK